MSNNYYQKHKKIFQKEVSERYQNRSEEENKRRRKTREKYQNFIDKEKEKRHNKKLFEEQKQKNVS